MCEVLYLSLFEVGDQLTAFVSFKCAIALAEEGKGVKETGKGGKERGRQGKEGRREGRREGERETEKGGKE